MTNEEKAMEMANCQNCIEIAKNSPNVIICNPDKMPCDRYRGFLEMAQWKDEQFELQISKIVNAVEMERKTVDKLLKGE